MNRENNRQIKEEGIQKLEAHARVHSELAKVKSLFQEPKADYDKIIADFKEVTEDIVSKAKK